MLSFIDTTCLIILSHYDIDKSLNLFYYTLDGLFMGGVHINSNVQNYLEPIYYKGSLNNAKVDLLLTIKTFDSAMIKKELDQFIHVEFTSNIFRFIDDVEFYLTEPGVIHFRSASRIGHSDLGVNRRRMNRIRLAFNARNKN